MQNHGRLSHRCTYHLHFGREYQRESARMQGTQWCLLSRFRFLREPLAHFEAWYIARGLLLTTEAVLGIKERRGQHVRGVNRPVPVSEDH
jgi:hypothetical protein